VTECDRTDCEDYANYLVEYPTGDLRTFCGGCLDTIRDVSASDPEVVRQL